MSQIDTRVFNALKIQGKVLSLSLVIKHARCSVTFRAIDREEYFPELVAAFDWVYCCGSRGLSSEEIDTEYFDRLCEYGKHVAIVYHTTQSDRVVNGRFHHTKQALDAAFECRLINSRMFDNFYVATLSCHKSRFDWGFVTSEDLADAAMALVPKIPTEVDAIVGIHRSGSIPAAIIASTLHLPCYVYTDQDGLIELAGGGRTGGIQSEGKCRLVIDDTVSTGGSIQRAKTWLSVNDPGNRYLYAAIFATPHGASELDLFAHTLRIPHLLEWNFLNSHHCRTSAIDLDGVLCFDPPPFDESTPEGRAAYLAWIASARVRYPARWGRIASIVSYRCEYTREATEAWLAANGIEFDALHLFPGEPEERTFRADQWKGKKYKSSSAKLFIESSSKQARDIHAFTRKPVLDIESKRLYGDMV